MKPIAELFDDERASVRSGVATRMAEGLTESWDLTLYNQAGDVLASDPFSFRGSFYEEGLDALVIKLLAGRLVYAPWTSNDDGSAYSAEVRIQPYGPS